MKRIMYCLGLAGMMAMVAGSAAALPAVQLADDCAAKALFDGQGPTYIGVLSALGIPGPAGWDVADFDADDLPDQQAMYLLAAVLCANDAGTTTLFNANKAAYLASIAQISDALEGGSGVPAEMEAAGAACDAASAAIAAIGTPPALGTLKAYLDATGPALVAGAPDLAASIGEFGGYAALLSALSDWVAGMGGLSSETNAYMEGFLTALIGGEIYPAGQDLIDQAAPLGALAGSIPNQATLEGMSVPTAQAIDIAAAGTALAPLAVNLNAFGDALQAVTPPSFDVYTGAKTVTEPFSGSGDYDGNGDSNAATYAKVGGGAAFVAAASGSNPFYTGAPGLPVAGVFGLSLLTAACGLGGIVARRRK